MNTVLRLAESDDGLAPSRAPQEHDEAPGWLMELALAENAASGVAYAIDCGAEGAAQPAAWAARQGYEAMELVASNMPVRP